MADTVREVIKEAHIEIGVKGEFETATAAEEDFAFRKLNALMDQWKAEELKLYQILTTTITATPSKQMYTIGTGGDFNISRPQRIDHVSYTQTNVQPSPGVEVPLKPFTDSSWQDVRFKGQTSTLPRAFWLNETFPLLELFLHPIPTLSALDLNLYSFAVLDRFALPTSPVSLPPGYERLLVKSLALEIAPSYSVEIDRGPGGLLAQAKDARAVVEQANFRLNDLEFDPGALIHGRNRGQTYNIFTD